MEPPSGRWRLEDSKARLRFDRRTPLGSSRSTRLASHPGAHPDPRFASRPPHIPPGLSPRRLLACSREVSSMRLSSRRHLIWSGLLAALLSVGSSLATSASEPDSKTYWDINDIRPGMKGT